MISSEILLERLARMILALRRGATLSFDGDGSQTEFAVTTVRGADEPQLGIRCHIRKRDGSMFRDIWNGCDWTIDNFYAEAAILTEADIAQLPPIEEIRQDPVVAAIACINLSTPTTVCGHRLLLRRRQDTRDDWPPLEIAELLLNGETVSLRAGINWADDFVHA